MMVDVVGVVVREVVVVVLLLMMVDVVGVVVREVVVVPAALGRRAVRELVRLSPRVARVDPVRHRGLRALAAVLQAWGGRRAGVAQVSPRGEVRGAVLVLEGR